MDPSSCRYHFPCLAVGSCTLLLSPLASITDYPIRHVRPASQSAGHGSSPEPAVIQPMAHLTTRWLTRPSDEGRAGSPPSGPRERKVKEKGGTGAQDAQVLPAIKWAATVTRCRQGLVPAGIGTKAQEKSEGRPKMTLRGIQPHVGDTFRRDKRQFFATKFDNRKRGSI